MDTFRVFIAFFLVISFPDLRSAASTNEPSMFTLRLIHKDSPESPTYPGNLTLLERTLKSVKESESRNSYLMSILQPDLLHPYVSNTGFVYLAETRIGEPGRYFFLQLDTAADISWILCKADRSFHFREPKYFNPYKSTTYHEIPCSDPTCATKYCKQGKCVYSMIYGSGTKAEGNFARDNFGFMAPSIKYTTFRNVLFVCADPEKSSDLETDYHAQGMLGMSPDPKSFTSQLAWYSGARFSYCLVPPADNDLTPMSYLKFGNDMGFKGPSVQTTQFVKHPRNVPLYFLNLLDISVNDKRIGYPPGTFRARNREHQGFIIDSGSGISHLQSDAYWKLHDEFMKYFMQFQLRRRENCPGGVMGKSGVQLCYILPDDFKLFPSMTFHFQGGDFKVAPEQVFIIDRKSGLLLLGVGLNYGLNILGAHQQMNMRIVYDNRENSLSFVPENCARDPR